MVLLCPPLQVGSDFFLSSPVDELKFDSISAPRVVH